MTKLYHQRRAENAYLELEQLACEYANTAARAILLQMRRDYLRAIIRESQDAIAVLTQQERRSR